MFQYLKTKIPPLLIVSFFLLIIFYRDRYLPVKNGLKTISLYRLSDVCLMLALWMSHHLWHENITFLQLNNAAMVNSHLHEHYFVGLIISLTIVMAAAAKSAQFPFSSWLPRAMEGPTPSSAIFYGSVAVHIGVFLLLRTYPFWSGQIEIKILVMMEFMSTFKTKLSIIFMRFVQAVCTRLRI